MRKNLKTGLKTNAKTARIRIIITIIVAVVLVGACAGYVFLYKGQGYVQCSDLQQGEWYPQAGECSSPEMRQKCDEFCSKHPSCCPGWEANMSGGGEQGGALQPLPLPSESEVASLSRNYYSPIKAINEGPAIYSKSGPSEDKVISDETIEKMKESGFNTVQLLMIDTQEGDKYVADNYSKSILLNDIVKIKKHRMAVWVALEYYNAPPGSGAQMEPYDKFKPAFLEFCKEAGALFEEYKVEYFTVNNEPDMVFREQTQWGTEDEADQKAAEFILLANEAAQETFGGKIINKATLFGTITESLKEAYLTDVDIASIDVGPHPDGMPFDEYKKWFDEYQLFATAAKAKNLPWMVGEYWQYDYFANASDYVRQNQLELAQVSFDAYLSATPEGAGYTWNDFSAFSLQPNGEAMRQAIKAFFKKI